ncbi:MAG TPA: LysR family transcriptional regulator [Ideonella sp.]|nr:LysR family transcriptional regulator [Ideonella sp.]
MNDKTDQRLRFTLRQLEVFTATARTGSTRAAADRVARSQSAASTSLADLEAALGQQLFDRVGRRLLLNERGRAFLPRAVSMLDQAVELQALFSEEQPTPLRMAASLTIGEYLLPEIVAAWKQARPQHAVRMVISNTSDVIAAVVGFEADVGFIEGRQTHPDISVKPWLSDELVLIAAPSHPLAGRPVSARELAAATWVLREPGSGTREASDRWLLEHLEQVNVEFELGSSEAIKRVVGSAVGIGCLSRYAVVEALGRGTLVELQTPLPREVRALSMVVHRQRRVGSSAQAFIEHCVASAAGRQGTVPAKREARVRGKKG